MRTKKVKRMITKSELESLYHITGEIRDIENQLLSISRVSNTYVGDTIRDYSTNAKGSIQTIRGFGINESTYKKQQSLYEKLRLKRNDLIEKKMKIEEELELIDDAVIRRIIRLKYFDRFSWESVAIAIDQTKSGEAMRKRLERFISDQTA
jgi:hypothetical protein